jgi:predicted transcriptional regulator
VTDDGDTIEEIAAWSGDVTVERERFIAHVEQGLADLAAGRVYSHAEVRAEMDARFPALAEPKLDAGVGSGYDQPMSQAREAEQPRPRSDEAERQRIVAKIERSLASLDAELGVPHAEVLAMIDARYPGSKK